MHVYPAEVDLESCMRRIEGDVETLVDEIEILAVAFEDAKNSSNPAHPYFFGKRHHFPNAHYGYLLAIFCKIDLLSKYRCGTKGVRKDQTARMISFLNDYFYPGRIEEHEVAVALFRHTLVHNGGLYFVYSEARKNAYTWRLHWSRASCPGLAHYTVSREDPLFQDQLLTAHSIATRNSPVPDTRCFNLALTDLANDLSRATSAFLKDVKASKTLQGNLVHTYQKEVILQPIKG